MGQVKKRLMEIQEANIINAWNNPKPGEWIMISETDIKDYKSDGFKQPKNTRAEVLDEASKIVNGERANTYGGPEQSFETIAKLWGSYFGTVYRPTDVAIMLALLKIARLKNSPAHRDSWVDLAGYAACGAECGLPPF
jgi:hypothetical protein